MSTDTYVLANPLTARQRDRATQEIIDGLLESWDIASSRPEIVAFTSVLVAEVQQHDLDFDDPGAVGDVLLERLDVRWRCVESLKREIMERDDLLGVIEMLMLLLDVAPPQRLPAARRFDLERIEEELAGAVNARELTWVLDQRGEMNVAAQVHGFVVCQLHEVGLHRRPHVDFTYGLSEYQIPEFAAVNVGPLAPPLFDALKAAWRAGQLTVPLRAQTELRLQQLGDEGVAVWLRQPSENLADALCPVIGDKPLVHVLIPDLHHRLPDDPRYDPVLLRHQQFRPAGRAFD
jgi:hypothetical protein